MLVDCHIHVDSYRAEDLKNVLECARESGVTKFIGMGENLVSSKLTVAAAVENDGLYAGVGVHPWHADTVEPGTLEQLDEVAQSSEKVVCIGEVGLDYQEAQQPGPDETIPLAPTRQVPVEVQQQVLVGMIKLARSLQMPLNVHTHRTSSKDILEILAREGADEVGGMIHGYQGNEKWAAQAWEMGFYISVGLPSVHPDADRLRGVLKNIPLEQLLMDSDSPATLIKTGEGPYPLEMDKHNEPRNLKFIAENLAQVKGLSMDEVMAAVSDNARRLFRI
jgi:TatD DNase family protein